MLIKEAATEQTGAMPRMPSDKKKTTKRPFVYLQMGEREARETEGGKSQRI